MRYSLRTLLIVMLLGGPLCALGWSKWTAYSAWRAEQAALQTQTLSPQQSATGQMFVVDTPPPDRLRLLPEPLPAEQTPQPMHN